MGHRPVYVPFIRRVTLGRVRPDCLSTDSEFLYNFGLVRTNTILYMRITSPAPSRCARVPDGAGVTHFVRARRER